MNKKLVYLIGGLLLVLLATSACGVLLSPPTVVQQDPAAIYTQAAQTVVAQATQAAGEMAVAQLTQLANATPTSTATMVPPTQTPVPPTPTATVPPTNTPVPPTATPTPIPCNRAAFVKDVTVRDGTQYGPADEFVKTWRLQNNGSCTWTADYDLVFVSGTRMKGDSAISLGGLVRPGEVVDVSVDLIAPDKSGTFTGFWMLRDPNGNRFGIGSEAQDAFWVRINVRLPQDVVVNLVNEVCQATWRTANGTVPCGGKNPDENGYVSVVSNPTLESGSVDDESAIMVRPNVSSNGFIQGSYPAYDIKSGSHFRTIVGCVYGHTACNVTFQLYYRANGGPLTSLGSWHEIYEGNFTKVDIDLDFLAGKSVEFVLMVQNNGDAAEAFAYWLLPRVVR